MTRTAIITGVTGQDGSYLAEHLLKLGHCVIGLTRSPDEHFSDNIRHLAGKIRLVYCPYDVVSLIQILKEFRPSEVYNLTGQSYVSKSWEMVEETIRSAGIIPINILEAIIRTDKSIRFFQASSCEIYDPSLNSPLNERSHISPYNPYGCSKALAHNAVAAYRNQYSLFAVCGVLYGHESSRRHEAFLSKKIVQGAVRIKLGKSNELILGNLDISRDWGYAPDYVEAMSRMLELESPVDLHICYGESHSVKDMVEIAFTTLGLDYKKHIKSSPHLIRSKEPHSVRGSNQLAKQLLNWAPKTTFKEMIQIMVRDQLTQESETKT